MVYGDSIITDREIPLYHGWNMIGYSTDSEDTHSVIEAFGASLPTMVTVYKQSSPGSSDMYAITNLEDDTVMERSSGYWVYNEGADMLWVVSAQGTFVRTELL